MFKIRNKETGLFSRGGTDPRKLWTKEGKSWSSIGHLKNHLNQYINFLEFRGKTLSSDNPYLNAEIVKVEINYDMCFKTDVMDMMNTIIDKKAKAEDEYQVGMKKWHEERERKQLEELKKKYE